jgi:hypothetical protein
MVGYSRDSFYRFKDLYKGGRVLQAIDDAIATLAIEQPAFGQVCDE